MNQLGRATGQARRLRMVTPHRLFMAIVSALAATRVETLADLLRAFNHQQGVRVAYKAFCNRLASPGSEAFMRAMCGRLMQECRLQTLAPEGEQAVARFWDIVIQDGSSFAVKQALREVFPGRFTTIEPAAVEIHATYSGYVGDVTAIHLAPDREAERQFLPDPASLTGCLLLADRGYPSVPYFEAVRAHDRAFMIRSSASPTRRVAMCAHLLLAGLVRALLRGRGFLRALQHTMRYLLANARRADVLRAAVEQKVAFVPGESFFADGTGQNIARLNFSNATPERIEEGVRRLARCLEILIGRRQA